MTFRPPTQQSIQIGNQIDRRPFLIPTMFRSPRHTRLSPAIPISSSDPHQQTQLLTSRRCQITSPRRSPHTPKPSSTKPQKKITSVEFTSFPILQCSISHLLPIEAIACASRRYALVGALRAFSISSGRSTSCRSVEKIGFFLPSLPPACARSRPRESRKKFTTIDFNFISSPLFLLSCSKISKSEQKEISDVVFPSKPSPVLRPPPEPPPREDRLLSSQVPDAKLPPAAKIAQPAFKNSQIIPRLPQEPSPGPQSRRRLPPVADVPFANLVARSISRLPPVTDLPSFPSLLLSPSNYSECIPDHESQLSSIRWHLSEGGFSEFRLLEWLGAEKKPTSVFGEVADDLNLDLVVLSMEAIHSKHVDGNLLAEFIPCPVLLLPV